MIPGVALISVSSQCDNPVDESKIKADLPLGSSLTDIEAYLDREGIDHASTVLRAGDNSRLTDKGIPADTRVVAAIVHDTGGFLFVKEDTQIFFILDDKDRLADYLFEEAFTGP